MSFHKPTKLQLAIHEAGHAYLFASVTGDEIPSELGLAPDGNGHFRGWSKRLTLLQRAVPFAKVAIEARASVRRLAAKELAIAIAGPIAEFRHRHRGRFAGNFVIYGNVEGFLRDNAFDVDGDFQRIRDIFGYLGVEDRVETFRGIIDAAEEILHVNWPSVRRLARELHDHGFLGEAALTAWFAKHPARPGRFPLQA